MLTEISQSEGFYHKNTYIFQGKIQAMIYKFNNILILLSEKIVYVPAIRYL